MNSCFIKNKQLFFLPNFATIKLEPTACCANKISRPRSELLFLNYQSNLKV